jgi:hypothetical protein
MNILSKDIIREWGLLDLPETKQVELVDRIGKLLYQAILVRSLDILSEKEEGELDVLLDKDATTAQDVLVFLASKIKNFDAIVAEEREKLKEDVMVPAQV